MGIWFNEHDDIKSLFDAIRLGDNPQHVRVPDSIREDAKKELLRRGVSWDYIKEHERS